METEMPTPQAYVDALNEIHAADRDLQQIVARLNSFTDRLSKFPGESCFMDVADEAQPPLDQLIPGARWYAPEFPSPDIIQSALRRRYDTRVVCRRIRDQLSKQQLSGAPPIPKL